MMIREEVNKTPDNAMFFFYYKSKKMCGGVVEKCLKHMKMLPMLQILIYTKRKWLRNFYGLSFNFGKEGDTLGAIHTF